jgi:predicted ester cyclase
MKKFLLLAAAPLLLISCTDKEDGMSEQAEKNLASMNGVIRSIESRDLSKLDQYMAADVIDHAPATGPVTGLDNVRKGLEEQIKFSEDMKTEVIKELADDEYVMSWLKFRGTVAMEQMGMKKGDSLNMNSMEVAKFNKDGKVIEHWTFVDPAEMAAMMNKMMSQPAADTTTR